MDENERLEPVLNEEQILKYILFLAHNIKKIMSVFLNMIKFAKNTF